jgi:hypothetical protein
VSEFEGEEQPWFAVRCLFHDDKNGTYEERTLLIGAASKVHFHIPLIKVSSMKNLEKLLSNYMKQTTSFRGVAQRN